MSADTTRAAQWEGSTLSFWRAQWHIPELHVFQCIGSTNDAVRDRALAGAPAGTVALAETQTAGRGRFGRRWQAPAGSSLLLSCLLRPAPLDDAAPGTLPLRVGLATATAIEQLLSVPTALKWPNDLVVAGAGKLGGILCEAIMTGDAWSIVAGIGINVRQQRDDWPPELRAVATSLDVVTGGVTDRAALATALLERIRPLFVAPLAPLSTAELAAFRARDLLANVPIVVIEQQRGDQSGSRRGTPVRRSGTGAGLAPDGALLLRTPDGVERITTGSVRIADINHNRSAAGSYP